MRMQRSSGHVNIAFVALACRYRVALVGGGRDVGSRSSRRVLTMTAKQEQEKQAEWAAFVSDLVKNTL